MRRLACVIGVVAALSSVVGCGTPPPVQGYEGSQGYMEPVHSANYYQSIYWACLTLCDPTPVYRVYVAPVGYPSYYRPWYTSRDYQPTYGTKVVITPAPVYHVYQAQRGQQAPIKVGGPTINTTVRPVNAPARVSSQTLPSTFKPNPPKASSGVGYRSPSYGSLSSSPRSSSSKKR